ncbi:hypothetical protein DES40_1742 [Litorimonas taeanensis]|uniref:Uncharacterized protein n=1 Tax=Litorimonas taeanensis TaxID=568099 RepID=A0A420WDA3_9PROT|nr:hypothetical protein [Litorimonas taeanensis]RKQ68966.1 hypothetical protein DES40_1742 [Litorimonas taeanensis]
MTWSSADILGQLRGCEGFAEQVVELIQDLPVLIKTYPEGIDPQALVDFYGWSPKPSRTLLGYLRLQNLSPFHCRVLRRGETPFLWTTNCKWPPFAKLNIKEVWALSLLHDWDDLSELTIFDIRLRLSEAMGLSVDGAAYVLACLKGSKKAIALSDSMSDSMSDSKTVSSLRLLRSLETINPCSRLRAAEKQKTYRRNVAEALSRAAETRMPSSEEGEAGLTAADLRYQSLLEDSVRDQARLILEYPEGLTLTALADHFKISRSFSRRVANGLVERGDWRALPVERGRTQRFWPARTSEKTPEALPALLRSEALILRMLHRHDGPASRSYISGVLQFSFATVRLGLQGLIDAGAIIERDSGQMGRRYTLRRGPDALNADIKAQCEAWEKQMELI